MGIESCSRRALLKLLVLMGVLAALLALGLAALGVLTAAVLAAIALRGSEGEASHLSPVPSFHVDIGSPQPGSAPLTRLFRSLQFSNAGLIRCKWGPAILRY